MRSVLVALALLLLSPALEASAAEPRDLQSRPPHRTTAHFRFFGDEAVEGTLEGGAENAILVYVDNERSSGTGVEDPISLTDGSGALDNAVSAGITTPADFEADFAWGTRDLSRSASGFDDRMGFRDIATNPADFAWVDATEAPEKRIGPARFARLVDAFAVEAVAAEASLPWLAELEKVLGRAGFTSSRHGGYVLFQRARGQSAAPPRS